MNLVRTCAVTATALVAAALPIATATPAPAAVGDADVAQCFASPSVPGCTLLAPDFNASDVEVTPDGTQVLMASYDFGVIRVFDRGAHNRLTPRPGPAGCFTPDDSTGCTATTGLDQQELYDLALSPDGRSVYAANAVNLVHLRRDPATGVVSPGGCYGPSPGCTSVPTFNGSVLAVAVSPDGQSVYVRGSDRLLAFERNTTDGTLVPEPDGEDCFTELAEAGCTDAVGLGGYSFEMTVSPDGRQLYYPIQNPGGIGFFQRAANGTLTQTSGTQGGCITVDGSSTNPGECATVPTGGAAMSNAWATTVSPSGHHVLLNGDDGTVVFSRDALSGLLTQTDCLSDLAISGCQQVKGSDGFGAEVSPDGTTVVIPSQSIAGAGIFAFDQVTGKLTQLGGAAGCLSGNLAAGCTPIPAKTALPKAAWSPDGHDVYLASKTLTDIVRDAAPTCLPVALTVPHDTAVSVPLSCSDPNGDPLTISATPPSTGGTLWAVDQAQRQVLFTPTDGFAGTSTFTYSALAKGVTSPAVTVTLTVLPDVAVSLSIATSVVKLDSRGRGKVKLRCPATEQSGPCAGRLRLTTRHRVRYDGKLRVVTLDVARFSVAAGSTRRVRVKLAGDLLALVVADADARKIRLVAKVRDQAGNKTTVRRRATIRLTS